MKGKKMKTKAFNNPLSQKRFTFPKMQKRYNLPPKNILFQKRNELKPVSEPKLYRQKETRKDWEKLRKDFLTMYPFCVHCYKKGILTKATELDHIIPHRGDLELFYNTKNLQALCKSCHSKKTKTEDNIRYKKFLQNRRIKNGNSEP